MGRWTWRGAGSWGIICHGAAFKRSCRALKQTKREKPEIVLAPLELPLSIPLSALPYSPTPFNDHNAPLHAIFVASKGSKGFECLFGLYLLYL